MRLSEKTVRYLGILLFIAIYIATRVPRLQNDIFSTDAEYWHDRSEKFINAISKKDYLDTYQKYHPGVTLMWETGLTAKAVSDFNGVSVQFVFDNLRDFHYLAKLTLVSWQLILSIILIYLLSKIFDFKKALFMVLLFTVEPFYIGNARLLHLDAQISLYLIIGLALSYLYTKKDSILYPIFAGFFFGLGALSKSIALGGLVFGVVSTLLLLVINHKFVKALKHLVLVLVTFVITYYGLFPALWVDAKWVLNNIFKRSFKVGEIKGHEQIFFGNETHDPGFWFYPTLLFLKLSLVTIFGFITYYIGRLAEIIKKGFDKHIFKYIKEISFIDYISIFYLGYFVVTTYFDKKVDRYPIPLYPFFGIVAASGFFYLKKKIRIFALIALSSTLIFSLVKTFPHYMTYTNPLIGDAKAGNEIVGQKLFGIGIYDLRNYIVKKYGYDKEVAINDPGPMQSIYEYTTYYISIEHPNSYDLAILGPNKKLPPSVVNSGVDFEYDSSVYINGLEFWRIFVKK